MPRPIQRSVPFDAAVAAQVAYLVSQGRSDWIDPLERAIDGLGALIAVFPQLHREHDRKGPWVLRRARLGSLPFYVWYAYDEEQAQEPVTLIGFFHTRQRERRPRL